MKVRVLKHFYYAGLKRKLAPGDVVDIPDKEAGPWLKSGLAEQDKVIAPKETKTADDAKAKQAEAEAEAQAKSQQGNKGNQGKK
jgi:hypothetical protein